MYLRVHVCGCTHVSYSSISLCLDTTYFVLLPMKTLEGLSIGNIQVFHSVQFHFFTEMCIHLFPSILALLLLPSSFCSFGNKYI